MPAPSASPPPPPPPPPPSLPAPAITSAAQQRLAAVRYVYIDEAVPRELLSLVHSFISHHKLSPSPHLCGQCFLIYSHHASSEQLLLLYRRVASLAAVTLLPSSLFLSVPSVPSSEPADTPPTRPVLLSFLSLFAEWRISCSSLSPDEKALVAHLTTSLSGYYGKVWDTTYTHLVTNSSRSDKFVACQKAADTCLPVLPAYIIHCYNSATLLVPGPKDVQRLLSGLRLCVTGIEAQERNTIMRVIQAEGGEYSANLTKTCTHLIAQKADGDKYVAAKAWGLHIVSKAWLLTTVKERRVVEESAWPVGKTLDEDTEKGEERKEGAHTDMEVDGNESKEQPVANGVGKMNGHTRSADASDEEDERKQERGRQETSKQQQQSRQQEEKRREEDEPREDGKKDTTVTATLQNGTETAGWKRKPKKAAKEQKPEEDDSLKTIPLPERTQSPRPTSPAAPPHPHPAAADSGSSSASASHIAMANGTAGSDEYLDGVQVLLCVPSSSAVFLRCVALIRAGGGTRLSSYRPTITHIVSTDVTYVQSVLRSDRLSLLPAAALTSSTSADFASALTPPIVSPDWLQSCHASKRLVSAAPFELAADEEAVPPPAPSRQSSVARQKVVSEFAAFNENIARDKRDGTTAASVPQKRRRKSRSSAKGLFTGKLFAFEGLELREQEELLLSIRNEGGDVLAADETEHDVHIVIAPHWTTDLPTKYSNAIFVTPTYITDYLTTPPNQPTTHSHTPATLDHCPLPLHSTPLPSFQNYTFALTGFTRPQQDQLKRLLLYLGARGVTDGMHVGKNTHLVCREGCAAGKKWELAWSGGWKGKVVRLQWLVECVRQGREVPLTDELVWKKEDGDGERQDERGREELAEEKHEADTGKRCAVAGTNGATSASPTADVEMQSEVQQPQHHHPSEQQNGREADEDDVDKTEQDSTAEHMDIETPMKPSPTTTTPPTIKPPAATHDTADEQTDILAPLPPPSPTSSNSSPFPTRYGRQHNPQQHSKPTNRIYTPPKTPTSTSAAAAAAAAAEGSGGGGGRGRRRRLAVEDKAVVVVGRQVGEVEEDPFGFEGADVGRKEGKSKEQNGKEKVDVSTKVKEKIDVQRKRIEEVEGSDTDDKEETSKKQQTKATREAKKPVADEVEKAGKAGKTAMNGTGKRDAKKLVEEELEQIENAEEEKQEEKGERRQNGKRNNEGDEPNAKAKVAASRLPGRKRLNTERRKENEEEEEEAEYVPPAAAAAAEEEEEEVKETSNQSLTSGKTRPSREAAKAQKATSTKQEKAAKIQEAEPTPSRKTRARPKQSVTPPSTSGDEEREEREVEDGKQSPTSSNDRPSAAGRKSARSLRKEQLKAKDAVSPVKPRPSRRTAAQKDNEAEATPDSYQPARTTRKRAAAQSDDVISLDSSDSSSSTAKRRRVSTAVGAAAVAAAQPDFKYRFAIASAKTMSVDKAQSLREMIERLGAECIDDAADFLVCSAVIIKDHTQLKRTEKVLGAIVAGLPILLRSYIEDSSKHGDFVSPHGYRVKLEDDMDETGRVLMKAAARWEKKRPFKGWTVYIADSARHKMLTNIIDMGGGQLEEEDVSACNYCLVDVREAGVEAVMRRMWNAGVAVYRSEMVVEYICYSDVRVWPEWDMEEFKLTKDNWKSAWSNPWKGEVAGSQSTHGTEAMETEGKRKRR